MAKMSDILIIGSGGAGLSAALRARELGLSVTVVTKELPTQSQTSMAQGGINASWGDDIVEHIADTVRSAHGLADEEMVSLMCSESSSTIEWLDSLGVPFSRVDGEDRVDSIARRRLGGASQNRACYAKDYTGLKILHTLYDRCVSSGVDFIDEHYLLSLITEEQRVHGALFWDIYRGEVVSMVADHTIIATGGYANIYQGYSTNANGSIGDGIATVMRAGGVVSDMEFVQFHPTALESSAILISESARGEGGYLLNHLGERFVDELSPRDVVARAIFEQIMAGHRVSLDIRHLGREKIESLMPQELHLCKLHANIDPITHTIPIMPVAHYTMGGIEVDSNSSITGLSHCYAIGECSNTHIHGANRLGGNSLLEIVLFGKRVAEQISRANTSTDSSHIESIVSNSMRIEEERIEAIYTLPNSLNFYRKKKILGRMLYRDLGITREHHRMSEVSSYVDELEESIAQMGIGDKSRVDNKNLIEFLEFQSTLLIARAVIDQALDRKESRGAHYRDDFPIERAQFTQRVLYRYDRSSK